MKFVLPVYFFYFECACMHFPFGKLEAETEAHCLFLVSAMIQYFAALTGVAQTMSLYFSYVAFMLETFENT